VIAKRFSSAIVGLKGRRTDKCGLSGIWVKYLRKLLEILDKGAVEG
jgi:hypothetical protein